MTNARARRPPQPGQKPAASLSIAQVLAWRMERQLVHPVGSVGIIETVGALAGVQAQVHSWAELAIALRRRDGSCGEATTAMVDRRLMRTWAMRGTLHLLDPAQAGALLALLAATRLWERPSWQRLYGLGPGELDKLIETVRSALDGQVLEREALIEEVAERSGSRDLEQHLRSGWGGLLKPLAWMGHLCNGPSRDGRVTFTSPDSWLAGWTGLPTVEEAARVAIPAYLRAHGPASTRTFHAWLTRSAGSAVDVRRWFELIADRLDTVAVDGEPALALSEDLEELQAARPSRAVRLLAGFDQYVLGPGTGDIRIVAAHRRAAVSRAAGWISPVVLDAGRVAGVWKLDDDLLSVTLFAETRPIGTQVLAAEAARVGAAVGRQLRLSVARG